MFPDLRDKIMFLDTETTGLLWWADEIFGVSLRVDDRLRYFDTRVHAGVRQWLMTELPLAKMVVMHNAKFDYHMLREMGVPMDRVKVDCTMIRAALCNEHELAYDLDHLALKYLKRRKDKDIWVALAEAFGGAPTKKAQMHNIRKAPPALVEKYATIDVDLCYELWKHQEKQIILEDLHSVTTLERDLLPVIARMEERGVRVDVERAERTYNDLDRLAHDLQRELNTLAGKPVNVNSAPQLRALFNPTRREDGVWVLPDGTVIPSTEGGAPSMAKDTLRAMASRHPAAALILKLRSYIKTRDTFIKGHILGHHVDGIIHANFNQTKNDEDAGTGTGRLSCTAPALQQIHKRNKEIASIVRAIFIPYERQAWLCADWEQKEFRWFAHYARNPKILKMYQDDPDTDFHQAVADLTGLPRSPTEGIKGNAKQINLGLVFGMGMGKLAQEMGLPYTIEHGKGGKEWLKPGLEAQQVFEQYHNNIPGVQDMLQKASTVARTRGYVETIMGRHIRFPGGNFTHKAAGLIFQGTSADCMKQKLIEIDREFAGTDVNLLLTVHDEMDFSIDEEDHASRSRIKQILETFDGDTCPIKCRVPIRADVNVNVNWWEASK